MTASLIATCCLSPARAQVEWAIAAGGPGDDDAFRVAVCASANAYLLGDFCGEVTFGQITLTASGPIDEWGDPPCNFYLAKVSPTGDWLWAKAIQADGCAEGLAVTSTGEAYVAARFTGVARVGAYEFGEDGSDWTEDGLLAKFAPDGEVLWAKHFKGTGYFDTDQLALDASQNVLFLGSVSGELQIGDFSVRAQGESDALAMKFTSAGALEWARPLGGIEGDFGSAMAVCADGSAWILGGFTDRATIGATQLIAPTEYSHFLTKLTSAGDVIETEVNRPRVLNLPSADEPEYEMVADTQGGFFLVGNFGETFDLGDDSLTPSDEHDDVFLSRFDVNGNVLWTRQFGSQGTDYADALVVTPDGNVIIAGAGGHPEPGDNPPHGFLHEIAPDGTLLSSLAVQTQNEESDIAFLALAQSACGALYAGGWFEGTLGIASDTLRSKGWSDILLVRARMERPPRLNIERAQSGIRLSWPATASDFALQTKVSPASSLTWEDVMQPPTLQGAEFILDITPDDTPRFYRLARIQSPTSPPGMVLIPAGSFVMGDTFGDGWSSELPLHANQISAFYMDQFEVTKALWDEVRTWAQANGYSFDNAGSGKATNHPVHTVNWYDVVKWCNARSEREGRVPAYYTSAAQTTVYRTGRVNVQNDWVKWNAGYRLPTEAEWEYAARGGVAGTRFPWADTNVITHSRANYSSSSSYAYDTSPTRGYHPGFQSGGTPYTSPVGYFAPNGYGLYDMAGNVWEWCWDWYGDYSASGATDPRGPVSGSFRVIRGGGWVYGARDCRVSDRNGYWPDDRFNRLGFRSVLPPGQP